MSVNNPKFDFHREVRQGLTSCGYEAHTEGIFTRGDEGGTADWLSVTGNSYFYIVSAGVVFPDLSAEMRDALTVQPGIAPLDGIPTRLIPFVFSPVGRYVTLPSRGRNPSAASALTPLDAQELIQCLCTSLPQVLRPFHNLERAVGEVEDTLETGGAKAFLLVLAYLKLGRSETAANFARKTIALFKSESTRSFYEDFLGNIGASYGVPLRARGSA
jgi:hypothetical protein